jgi:hemolysin III
VNVSTDRAFGGNQSVPFAPAIHDPAEQPIEVLAKPRLRGWIHLYSAGIAAVAGTTLVIVSWMAASKRAGHSTLAYTAAIVAMFAVSALYHRVNWASTTTRKRMRQLDHAMIFVFIAGTYTPVIRLAMPRSTGHVVLALVWGAALVGVALTLFWPEAPRWVGVPLYLLLGWAGVWYTGMILHTAGMAAIVLLAAGGLLYSVGAVFYGLRRPDPWPSTFGYHELFHACTAVAALCHYIAIWFVVF